MGMGITLVVNPGSSSKKYALYVDGQAALEWRFEQAASGFEVCERRIGATQTCEPIKRSAFQDSFARVKEETTNYLKHLGAGRMLEAVVVRVVAPGSYFQSHRRVDEEYLAALRAQETAAPLHIPSTLRELTGVRAQFAGVPIIAASDSAFHQAMPARARRYSIPAGDAASFDLYRFGYHGLSVASVVRRLHPLIGQDPSRLVVCHIGSGTSVTAVRDGASVATSMSYSPASGVPMGSRAGDLDAAGLLQLMRQKRFRPLEAEVYLNTMGGLAGMSGDGDIRRLLDRRAQGDAEATTALETFVYHLQCRIAEMVVPLGGLEVIALTATAAVRSSELRELLLRGLSPLGVTLDPDRNAQYHSRDGVISASESAVKVVVIRTDEMGEMAQIATTFLRE